MVHKTASWREECISVDDFLKAAQNLSDEQRDNGKDFLQLVQTGGRDIVFVTEGHHKQQSVALNIQLPTAERADFCDLAPPPHPHWMPAVNMVHPAAQLSRELHGNRSRCNSRRRCTQTQQADQEGVEGIPFGVTERCKLLTVQFITKQPKEQQQQPQEEMNPFMQHPLQQHDQRHPVLSAKVTLQRMSASPGLCTEQVWEQCNQEQQQNGALQLQQLCDHSSSPILQLFQCYCKSCRSISSTSSYSTVGYSGQHFCEQAYVCVLEYPLFQLQSSDYIVPADIFDRGLQQWSIINNRDKFTMLWDDTPYSGHALKFRQRPSDDPFLASPWRSIEVEWEDHAVDRDNDPEDWCYGNPWEMIRSKPHAPSRLLISTAAAMVAPWTEAGAAAMAAVEAGAKKRKTHRRPKSEEVSDDFTAFDGDMFYYDDDPEEYRDYESHSRRKRYRQHQQRGQRATGNSSRLAASSAVSFSKRPGVAAAAEGGDDSEPKHSFGREMMGLRDGVCLVCGKKGGHLVTGHSSRASQNCSRVYHVGCLLLLNSLGIRTTMQTKQQQRQQQQQQEAPDAAAVAAVQTDGLLQQLRQQQQSDPHLLSPAAAAAVDEAAAAAVLHQDKQIDVCCPAHYCHGCGLNGKHEYMVWCCCCLLRVYHWRNCIPLGAEAVKLNDKDYIRCPACVAAGVPLPGTAAGAETNVVAELGASAAAHGLLQGSRRRRGRQLQQQDGEQLQQLALQPSRQQSELAQGIEEHHSQLAEQHDQQQQQPASPSGVAAADADGGGSDSAEHDSLVALADTAELINTEADVDNGAAALNARPAADARTPGISVEDLEGSLAAAAAAADVGSRRQSPAPAVPLDELEERYQKVVALQQQYEHQQQHSGGAADTEEPMVGHSAEPQQLAPATSVVDEALARTRQQRLAAPAGGSVGRVTRGSLRAGNITGGGSGSIAAAVIKTASSSGRATPAGGSSSSALDALMPAWLRFSLEDSQRHLPSYKLVALPDGSSDSRNVAASDSAAAALRHVAAAVTRLPFQAADVAGTATELSLCSPQTHWLIGSAEKAESAKYKATGSGQVAL